MVDVPVRQVGVALCACWRQLIAPLKQLSLKWVLTGEPVKARDQVLAQEELTSEENSVKP